VTYWTNSIFPTQSSISPTFSSSSQPHQAQAARELLESLDNFRQSPLWELLRRELQLKAFQAWAALQDPQRPLDSLRYSQGLLKGVQSVGEALQAIETQAKSTLHLPSR
jgi:hypothetical protein